LSVVLGASGLWLMAQAFGSPREMLLSTQSPGNALGALTFPIVGALIVWHRPGNRIGWLLCGASIFSGVEAFTTGYTLSETLSQAGENVPRSFSVSQPPASLAGEAARPVLVWLMWVRSWAWIPWLGTLITLLPLIYPNGHLVSPRWRPVAWLSAGWMMLLFAGGAFNRATIGPFQLGFANPAGIPGAEDALLLLAQIALGLLAVTWVASVLSLVVRYRRSGSLERQQIRWLIFSVAVLLVTQPFVSFLQPLVSDDVRFLLTCVALLALTGVPLSIGIAILRYRLYDIDLIIRRTLIYGALTAGLGLVYWGSVVVLQQLLRPVTQGSDLAIVGSTLAVAALFQPARQRIQALVDQRFYRRKYNTARTLDAFSTHLREEVDLESLSAELLAVVGQTMQPERLSLWLRPPVARSGGR
jgi:hypothetical protein